MGELDHRLHHRREPGDRAGAQIVAVGEAAGDDDRVDALQVTVAVPEQLGVADPLSGEQRVDVVTGAGEADDAELHASLDDLVVLDQRVDEQPLAHRRQLGRILDVELDQAADVDAETPPKPSAGSARSTAWPWGSRIPALGRTSTRARISSLLAFARSSRRRSCR